MMRLTAYISRVVLASTLLILVALIGLELFVLYVNELGDIGHGHYGTLQAFYFVLMSLPEQVYMMFPCVCLIGAMMGLGELAERSELTVMRSAGLTTFRIARIVVQLAVVLVFFMSIFGETVVPRMTHFAENYKAYTSSRGQAMRTKDGTWLRSGDAFVYIHQVIDSHHLRDIQQFRFNSQFVATESLSARSAVFNDGNWVLENVEITAINKDKVSSKTMATLPWKLQINPALLKVASLNPPEMPLWVLHRFIRQQQENHIDVGRYQLDFWERILHPFTSAIMMLLAVPFVFGQLRSTMGSRLMLGILSGFGYYMLNRFLGPISLVYQWPPVLAAILPSLIFLILAGVMFRRTG